ncbi:fatty acyl-AMP ligase [Streptomyces xylophagus]|uniref:fatty acyl-AMP ligase n=1 Tax=Streptomyces xylophagus TaxID=285514 RepID=UPI001F1A833F|nr:fatty acyl-AMP ligase [Streptomyces xylophagus]
METESSTTSAVTFVPDPGRAQDSVSLTHAELDTRARRTAVWLAERTEPGDRVLLLYPPGVDFAAAFFGCLYAGLVAVPGPLPGRYRHERRRLAGIALDARARVLLTDRHGLKEVEKWAADEGLAGLVCHPTDTEDADPDAWRPRVRPGPDTVALLQYTSGSVGAPKGVMVRHGDLQANLDSGWHSLDVQPSHRFGGWIPLYHDMGLIGLMLPGILMGNGYVQMDPMTFLRRPHQWLQLLDTFDVNFTASPDFGYELCLRRVSDDQLADLDLSRVHVAVNSSEPIRSRTVTGFIERFGTAGFSSHALAALYGLAESTLVVTSSGVSQPPYVVPADVAALERSVLRRAAPGVPSRDLVGCGSSTGLRVRIVDPDSSEVLPVGRIGEIWVSGPSVTAGYWEQAEATKATFEAHTADGQGPFLRTGDLGGLLDGHLFVTGRRKDVLVLHGRNIHPQDVEDELRSHHEELRGLHGAVFTVGGNGDPGFPESVVVLHEIRGHWGPSRMGDIASAMKLTVAREIGVPVGGVLLLRPGAVHRTTSGKVKRSAMRARYLSGALEPLLASEDPHLTAALGRPGPAEAV